MRNLRYKKFYVSFSLFISFQSWASPVEISSLAPHSQEQKALQGTIQSSSLQDDCPPLPKKKIIRKKIYKAPVVSSDIQSPPVVIKRKKIIHKKAKPIHVKCGYSAYDHMLGSNQGISNQLDDRATNPSEGENSLNPEPKKIITPEQLQPMFEKPIEDPSDYYQTENMKKGIYRSPYPYYIPPEGDPPVIINPIYTPPSDPPKKPNDPATPVPEPSTYLIFILGLGLMMRNKKQVKK